MAVYYHKGDLLKADVDIIAHGCNCQQIMGAGIAKYISQIYPEARRADRHFIPSKAKDRLGMIDVVSVHQVNGSRIKYVANCYTQLNIGGGLQIRYSAISKCMNSLSEYVSERDLVLGIPKIGAGLGGGNWDVIKNIIDSSFKGIDVHVYSL